ncbi:MAG: threonine synthase [Pseudomonadota bacterium]|nr:threonine synthase [Pseudomonadota bacterium]
MKYLSTRGEPAVRGFSDILLEGLAPDGGLFLPERYPRIDAATLVRWRQLTYPELAFELISLYADDVPADALRRIVAETYTAEAFGDARITPLRSLGPGIFVLGLSNGPTLAFKDVAMQFLGNAFQYELTRRGRTLNVLGATSGDTGGAAEHALKGKRGVRVFMLSPLGRMSEFQQAQMFSLQDANIHNIAIEGVFDGCQDLVKGVSADLAFKERHSIGTVNSINWARLLAQIVYYFAGYFQATSSNDEFVDFAVPTGNFGNICAGHVARQMGLPIRRLVLATNENDVLDEFFRSGSYRVRSAAETHETSSPSMDISKASNFERFVFDALGRDPVRTRELFAEVESQRVFSLTQAEYARIGSFGFASGSSSGADRLTTIDDVHRRFGEVIDPHTADALKVGREYAQANMPMIVLETALPAKFNATVRAAIGIDAPRPPRFAGIESLPRRFTTMPVDLLRLKAFIAENS